MMSDGCVSIMRWLMYLVPWFTFAIFVVISWRLLKNHAAMRRMNEQAVDRQEKMFALQQETHEVLKEIRDALKKT